jgi:hypothetical protein
MKPKPPPASSNHIKGDNRGRGGMAMKGGEGGGGVGGGGGRVKRASEYAIRDEMTVYHKCDRCS